MNAEERKALEARGYKVYDHTGDAVGMTEEEKQLLDARLDIAFAVGRQREALNLSQEELGKRLKTSQSRVAKIEQAAPDVSFDQLLRAYLAIGGRVHVKDAGSTNGVGAKARKKKAARPAKQIELVAK